MIKKTYKTLDKEVALEISDSDPIHIMVSGGMYPNRMPPDTEHPYLVTIK